MVSSGKSLVLLVSIAVALLLTQSALAELELVRAARSRAASQASAGRGLALRSGEDVVALVKPVWDEVVAKHQHGLVDPKQRVSNTPSKLSPAEAAYHHKAAMSGIVDSARFLLTFGVTASVLEVISKFGDTDPIAKAILNDDIDALKLELQNSPNVDTFPEQTESEITPLHFAVAVSPRPHDSRVVDILIANGADSSVRAKHGATPLMVAAALNRPAIVRSLLQADRTRIADKHAFAGTSALHFAAEMGHAEVIRELCIHGEVKCDSLTTTSTNGTALHTAADSNRPSVIADLVITCGCDPNAMLHGDSTAIYLAAQRGHDVVIEQLAAVGADLNLVMPRSSAFADQRAKIAQRGVVAVDNTKKDANIAYDYLNKNTERGNGATALHAASENGHPDTVDVLLRLGARQLDSMEGTTPLVTALQYGHPEIALRLLRDTNDLLVNARTNRDGAFALFVASGAGFIDVVQRILERPETNVSLVNHLGASALSHALYREHERIALMLLNSSARIDLQVCAAAGRSKAFLKAITGESYIGQSSSVKPWSMIAERLITSLERSPDQNMKVECIAEMVASAPPQSSTKQLSDLVDVALLSLIRRVLSCPLKEQWDLSKLDRNSGKGYCGPPKQQDSGGDSEGDSSGRAGDSQGQPRRASSSLSHDACEVKGQEDEKPISTCVLGLTRINSDGLTLVHTLARTGRMEILKCLFGNALVTRNKPTCPERQSMDNGAVDKADSHFDDAAEILVNARAGSEMSNASVLYVATSFNQTQIVSLLLDYGADVSKGALVQDKQNQPSEISSLFVACEKGFVDIVRLLVTKGRLDVNDVMRGDGEGNPTSSLLLAAHNGHYEIVKEFATCEFALDATEAVMRTHRNSIGRALEELSSIIYDCLSVDDRVFRLVMPLLISQSEAKSRREHAQTLRALQIVAKDWGRAGRNRMGAFSPIHAAIIAFADETEDSQTSGAEAKSLEYLKILLNTAGSSQLNEWLVLPTAKSKLTPLALAVEAQRPSIVAELMQAHDLDSLRRVMMFKSSKGETPLQIAHRVRDPQLIAILGSILPNVSETDT